MKDATVEITRAQLLNRQYTSYCANNWILINARIYNKDHTRYRKIKLVINLDADDLYERFYDGELPEYENDRGYTKHEMLDYAREVAYFTLEGYINSYDDVQEAYDYAAKTIERYNQCGTW